MRYNTQSLNSEKIMEFLDSIFSSNKYEIEKNSNYDHSSSIIIKVRSGGSSGGNCWGDSASSFNVSHEDMVEDFKSELSNYYLKELLSSYEEEIINNACQEIADDYIDNYFSTNEDYGDYYGNHTDYKVYDIPLNILFSKILNEQDLSLFSECLVISAEKKKEEITTQLYNFEVDQLIQNIEKFNITKVDTEKKLQKNLADAKKQVLSLEKELSSFEKNKDLELKKMKNRQNELEIAGYLGTIKNIKKKM